MHTAHETWLIFRRAMLQSLRNPAWVLISLGQPVLYLALFVPLLRSLVGAPGFPPGDEWQVMVPALLVQLALFGTAFVGFTLIAEYRSGVIERMRVTPVSRAALLLGRSLCDVVVLTIQGALLIVLAVPFGLRTPLGGAVLALALVA
ncbi:MAG: ABC transporter permease, partial [Pseudonocardiaceae bacterium]